MKFCTGHWMTKTSIQVFPASFRFYHCSLQGQSFNFRKFLPRPNATTSIALNQEFYHKSHHAKSIVNKHDYVNMNIIMITQVIILNYRYDINSIETTCTLVECQLSECSATVKLSIF